MCGGVCVYNALAPQYWGRVPMFVAIQLINETGNGPYCVSLTNHCSDSDCLYYLEVELISETTHTVCQGGSSALLSVTHRCSQTEMCLILLCHRS